jgi:replication factor C subunit 3/5
VRVPAPSELEVCDLLASVAEKEAVQLPPEFAAKVAAASDRNMRRALLSLEACKVACYPFKPDQVIQNTDWELYIAQIAREIMSDQSPKTLFIVRGRLYELLINAISPELILKKLAAELQSKLDAELKYEVSAYAAYFEHRLQLGQKAIIHLEAFVARFSALPCCKPVCQAGAH